jgi:hypothetical protein
MEFTTVERNYFLDENVLLLLTRREREGRKEPFHENILWLSSVGLSLSLSLMP